jgi:putative aldouronate transport system permease protein
MRRKKFDLFNLANGLFFIVLLLLMLYPFWYIIMYSLSDPAKAGLGGAFLVPRGFTLDSYKTVLRNKSILTGFRTSTLVTLLGTGFGVLIGSMISYSLSKTRLRGGTFILFLIFFTMLFHGGMIPNYLLVKYLGLLNTYAALILPLLISPFHIFIMKNFFKSIPDSVEESAKMDGANDLLIFFRLILPLSKAVIATITLFVAVRYWNDFFSTVLYITSKGKWSLQAVLRDIITAPEAAARSQSSDVLGSVRVTNKSLKMANILITTLPILLVYPFLQKHFVKGVMIGSIKG